MVLINSGNEGHACLYSRISLKQTTSSSQYWKYILSPTIEEETVKIRDLLQPYFNFNFLPSYPNFTCLVPKPKSIKKLLNMTPVHQTVAFVLAILV